MSLATLPAVRAVGEAGLCRDDTGREEARTPTRQEESMPFMPFHILGIWLRGLLSLAIPILAAFCLKGWHDDSRVVKRVQVARPEVVRVEAEPSGQVKTAVRLERV